MKHHLPLITAHTGCEDTPDNSLESMLAGIRAGADTIEIDVRAARDGTPVLMHDPAVVIDGRTVPVGECDLGELNAALAGDPADGTPARGVTTLEQALHLLGSHNVMINLDMKDDRCIGELIRLVRAHVLGERAVLTGCTPERAEMVRALAPELPVLLNAETPALDLCDDAYAQFVDSACRTATRHHCCGINVFYRACRAELVAHSHRRYLPVSVWTVNDTDDMKMLARMGVHSITTHRPRQLISVLDQA